ncbi:hypothetical protein N7474_007409 [Penicillium riverlandense]|uniref:uncharacterized protein n=1 Tax=Penicillium riverlandense TaxID=1903569 RepID=UPI002549A41A|nr:uncharacterized protein N7474_007409 [Penicillium riverlandense]KAJ5815632.1 hypothetical protein N7474_007409 [Penicillium riverlandense]
MAGPGASATSSDKPKSHSSKVMNKLDPWFDQNAIEAQQSGLSLGISKTDLLFQDGSGAPPAAHRPRRVPAL